MFKLKNIWGRPVFLLSLEPSILARSTAVNNSSLYESSAIDTFSARSSTTVFTGTAP